MYPAVTFAHNHIETMACLSRKRSGAQHCAHYSYDCHEPGVFRLSFLPRESRCKTRVTRWADKCRGMEAGPAGVGKHATTRPRLLSLRNGHFIQPQCAPARIRKLPNTLTTNFVKYSRASPVEINPFGARVTGRCVAQRKDPRKVRQNNVARDSRGEKWNTRC